MCIVNKLDIISVAIYDSFKVIFYSVPSLCCENNISKSEILGITGFGTGTVSITILNKFKIINMNSLTILCSDDGSSKIIHEPIDYHIFKEIIKLDNKKN
jgi:hypothetical protein